MTKTRTRAAIAAAVACLTTSTLTAGVLSATPAASAATPPTQKICSSNASAGSLFVLYPSGKDYEIPVGWCKTEVPYGSKIFVEDSYRVSYGGDVSSKYSECRGNTGFVPWKGAQTIWFKSYNKNYCKN